MARPGGARAWLPRILCGVLIASVLANMAAAAAAWHQYQLLLALPPERTPYGTEALLNADMWFGNLMGWRKAAIVTSVLLLIAWLDSMRTLAETLWPEGQRRRRAWLLFAWGIPVVNLIIPKMFINDLWAATQPGHRRGHPLLTASWLSVVLAFNSSGNMLDQVPRAANAAQACAQMREVIRSDAFFAVAALFTVAVVWCLSGMLQDASSALVENPPPQGNRQPVVV